MCVCLLPARCCCPYQVFLTNNHLNIVMEYANSGSLFDHVKKHRRLSEEKARSAALND